MYRDAQDTKRIKLKMVSDGVRPQDLPYRDMEKLRQVGVSSQSEHTHTRVPYTDVDCAKKYLYF